MFYELRDFCDYLEHDLKKSRNTISAYKKDVSDYLTFLKKYRNIVNLDFVTRSDIVSFINSLKRKELTATTIARKISSLKSFHIFLKEEGIAELNPAIDLDLPKKEVKMPEVLTLKEINLLLESIDNTDMIGKRNKAMFEVMYASGLRVSELLNLKTSDLHLTDHYLRIFGKGRKERLVPIGDIARFALIDYIENARSQFKGYDKSYVFYNYKGEPLSRQAFNKILNELAVKSGITKKISPHTLRHSFATHLLKNGTDLRVIKDMLGHSSIATTEIYTNLNKEDLKEVYNKTYPSIKEESDV